MANLSVMKELHGLLRKADKLYNGQVEIVLDDGQDNNADTQREVEDENQDNERYLKFDMNITPTDGLYKNATCKFRVFVCSENYPCSPPTVHCLSKVYHPNIDCDNSDLGELESNVCVNALSGDWQPEMGLDGCVMAVLFLFYHPQIDDALSPVCCNFNDESEFEENLRLALRGEEIDGIEFDRLIAIDENEDKDELEATTPDEKEDKDESEATALDEKEDKDESEATTLDEKKDKDESEATALDEKKDKDELELEATALDEKEDKDESEATPLVQDTTESEAENSKPEVDQSQSQTCLQNNLEETDQSQIISLKESKSTEQKKEDEAVNYRYIEIIENHIKAWFLKLKEKFF